MPRAYKKLSIEDYEITQEGQVINKLTGKIVKPQRNGKGYLRVSIGGKLMFVHRIVAEKYIPNPENKPQVNHKDGNKENNCVENLEWVSNQQNRNHAVNAGLQIRGEKCPWAKLTEAQVEFIRAHTELSSKEMAKVFGVSDSNIRAMRRMKSWKH